MAAALAVVGLVNGRTWVVSPEAEEDVSIFGAPATLQLQVRSHRGRTNPLGIGEFASWLVKLWQRQGTETSGDERSFGLVVDHPVAGVPATGLSETLGDQSNPKLVAAVEERLVGPMSDAHALLARTHLLLAPEPAPHAADLLADHFDVAPAVAEVVFRQILAGIGELSDARAHEGASMRGLTVTELSRLIDDTLAVVDLEAVEAVVKQGVCEYVDFVTPVDDRDFYLGVDTVPGHVAAGLVLDRPDEVEMVVRTLEDRGRAIVTGPSGVGKTSLAWLTAFATRHCVRWLRVRQARVEHVAALLRYAEALRPSPPAPVAFVVDDIGRLGAVLWDALALEAVHRAGVLLLGTAREEDLDLIEAASAQTLLRPRLTEALAEAMWHALSERGQTAVPAWREAFEDTNGLTLEYTHLISTGERLAETIESQVARRRRERRDLELRTLRVAGVSAMLAGAVDVDLLRAALDVTDDDLQRAFARLFHEHLLHRIDDNSVGGVHRLRSEAIARASHAIPPPTEQATARTAVATLRLEDLPGVAAAAIDRGLIDVDVLGDCLLERLRSSPTPAVLARSLEALRTVGLLHRARHFDAVLDGEHVPTARRQVTVSLAAIGTVPMAAMAPEVQAALPRLTAAEATDPRAQWLDRVPAELLQAVVGSVVDTDGAIQLLESCQGLPEFVSSGIMSGRLAPHVADLPLPQLTELIAAAQVVSTDLADEIVDAAGGTEALLDRTRSELAWVISVELDETAGDKTVRAEWLYTGADEQADPHGEVVNVCRVLAGLFPRAMTIAATAVDPSGQPAGFGNLAIAEKHIPRRNLPSDGQVRWNRALLRTYADITATQTKTVRLIAEAELVRRTADVLGSVSDRWVHGQGPEPAQLAELESITTAAVEVPKTEVFRPGELPAPEPGPDVGSAAELCGDICGNALRRLFATPNASLTAFLHDHVLAQAEALTAVEYWRLIDFNGAAVVKGPVDDIRDVHAVLSARLATSRSSSRLRRTSRSATAALKKAANVAREEAATRLESRMQAAKDDLTRLGHPARLFARAAARPNGLCWPPDDVAVIVDTESLFDLLRGGEQIVGVTSDRFEDLRQVTIIPRRQGLVVPQLALEGRRVQDQVVPAQNGAHGWEQVSGDEALEPMRCGEFERLMNGTIILRAIERLWDSRAPLAAEQAAYDSTGRTVTSAAAALRNAVASDGSGFLSEVLGEIQDLVNGSDVDVRIATALRGGDPETLGLIAAVRVALTEWDVDPTTAASLTLAFALAIE